MPRLLLSALLCAALSSFAGAFEVVVDGQPKATIVVPADASEQLKLAAGLLQQYVAESTGATLPIATAVAGPAIFLGDAAAHGVELGELDDDGFVLQPVGDDYLIAGPTDWGTEFGVTEFLERYVGVRWLLPGEHGTDVPKQQAVRVPDEPVRLEPAFFSRLLSGLRGEAQGSWARRNRMHGRVSFHHNLLHLFPPSQYFATHPEFYPIVNGERYEPTSDSDPRWQPNFSAPGIVDEAIRNIKQFFRDHPEATSYSLGINDGRAYDESPESLARENGKLNFLGIRDVSDSYYQWANEVVEGVLEEFPDKWFGLLAYSNVAEPPSRVKVHERIIPYMTYDRMKWVKPELEAQGHELTQRWHAMSPTLGWYDYAYGSPYAAPRVYPHQMAEYLKFGRDQGVRAHYAEIYPNWGEGPKPYIYLKLQWNPDLDVDAALDDWYQRAVGTAAAPLLKEYYAIWERFWTQTVIDSPWWRDEGQYLSFSQPQYLADVPIADVRRARELMDGVVAKAGTPGQRARAELLARAFDYYESSVISYQAQQDAAEAPITNEAQALAALEDSEERLSMSMKRRRLLDEFKDHPVLVHPLDYDRYPALNGETWGAATLWRLFHWAKQSEAVRARIAELGQSEDEAVREQASMMLALLEGQGELVSVNPSVEDGFAPWNAWVKTTGKMVRTDEAALTGKYSVLCDGMERGGPNQAVAVTPGRYLAVAYAHIPDGQVSHGTVAISGTMRGDDNVNLPSPQTMLVPPAGGWTTLVSPVTVPAQINGKQVTKILLVAIVDGFKEGEKVYLDDIALYRLPDTN